MGLCIGMSEFLIRIFLYKLGSGMITDVCLFIIGLLVCLKVLKLKVRQLRIRSEKNKELRV